MVFAFGDSVLDVDRRELRRGGEPVALGCSHGRPPC